MLLRRLLFLLTCLCLALLAGASALAKEHAKYDELKDIFTGAMLKKLFPGAQKDGACYIFRLDACKVVAVASYTTNKEVQLILLNGPNIKETMVTAGRLAELISDKCTLSPFEDKKQPGVAIFLPNMSSLDHHLTSPMNPILFPRPGCEKLTRIVGWKGGLLVTHVTSKKKGMQGVVEITVNPHAERIGCIELRKVRGNIDMERFLHTGEVNFSMYSSRIWGGSEAPLDSKTELELRKKLNCKKVLQYSKSNFCLIDCGGFYRAGSTDYISQVQEAGKFSAPEFVFPEEPLPWPKNKNTTTTDEAS